MSSPRKYSSPYLSSIPGMPKDTKVKKRSKASIKTNDPVTPVPEDGIDETEPKLYSHHGNFDPSGGDVTNQQVLDDFKEAAKSMDVRHGDADLAQAQQTECKEDKADVSTTVQNKPDQSENEKGGGSERNSIGVSTEDVGTKKGGQDVAGKMTTIDSSNFADVTLKSILKKAYPYAHKLFGSDPEAFRKQGKGSKLKTGKNNNSSSKETYLLPSRVQTKHLSKEPATSAKLMPATNSKKDQKPHQSAFSGTSGKSPRKTTRTMPSTQSKSLDRDAQAVPCPLSMRKSVRFSNKIDVYPVPYENRAGSRACDWQRNMLEQRVQAFQEIMKGVVSAEEMEMFGTGMIFPGYPFHVPNPNFAIRGTGRPRNFKM